MKVSRKPWELLYSPMVHLDVGVEEWKEVHEQMELDWHLQTSKIDTLLRSSTEDSVTLIE